MASANHVSRRCGAPARMTRLLVGLSPRLLRAVPRELGFRGKTLQYLEQSVAHWVLSHGALAVMIPSTVRGSLVLDSVSPADFAERLDGLILQGGADIHPSCYGKEPAGPGHATDLVRDLFELELLRAFIAAGKPVLGICRGMQLINVVQGGTLHQDLIDDGAANHPHHHTEAEEDYRHGLLIEAGSWLADLYDGRLRAQVNSIHHQGIDRLGADLIVEARSDDGVIEAIRQNGPGFVVGVQWHPEYHDERFPDLLGSDRLMVAFLAAIRNTAKSSVECKH